MLITVSRLVDRRTIHAVIYSRLSDTRILIDRLLHSRRIDPLIAHWDKVKASSRRRFVPPSSNLASRFQRSTTSFERFERRPICNFCHYIFDIFYIWYFTDVKEYIFRDLNSSCTSLYYKLLYFFIFFFLYFNISAGNFTEYLQVNVNKFS